MTVVTHSSSETQLLGCRIGKKLAAGSFVALYGGMGMGKTAFVTGIAEGMGLDADVSSPTFAIVNEYRGDVPLCHFDMYRIDGWDDLYSTGFFDYLDSGAVLAVEWSENIEAAIPPGAVKIEISRGEGENDRVFKIEGGERFEDIGG